MYKGKQHKNVWNSAEFMKKQKKMQNKECTSKNNTKTYSAVQSLQKK